MTSVIRRTRPLVVAAIRSATLIAVALLLILVLLPAVLGGAGPPGPI